MQRLYKQFGIYNLFCPLRPNGSYRLDMQVFEEKQVLKMLCELARHEGWENFNTVTINGKPLDKFDAENEKSLVNTGVW